MGKAGNLVPDFTGSELESYFGDNAIFVILIDLGVRKKAEGGVFQWITKVGDGAIGEVEGGGRSGGGVYGGARFGGLVFFRASVSDGVSVDGDAASDVSQGGGDGKVVGGVRKIAFIVHDKMRAVEGTDEGFEGVSEMEIAFYFGSVGTIIVFYDTGYLVIPTIGGNSVGVTGVGTGIGGNLLKVAFGEKVVVNLRLNDISLGAVMGIGGV